MPYTVKGFSGGRLFPYLVNGRIGSATVEWLSLHNDLSQSRFFPGTKHPFKISHLILGHLWEVFYTF